jgi:hypothetical protein
MWRFAAIAVAASLAIACDAFGPSIPVTGIVMHTSGGIVQIGSSLSLSAEVIPSDATNRAIFWVSGNPFMAEVTDAGVVTGTAPGLATVYAVSADGRFVASASITVDLPPFDSPVYFSALPPLSQPSIVAHADGSSAIVSNRVGAGPAPTHYLWNGGTTTPLNASATDTYVCAIAAKPDLSWLVLVQNDAAGRDVLLSTNGGSTVSPASGALPYVRKSCAISADGLTIVTAGGASTIMGRIQASADGGATWATAISPIIASTDREWTGFAIPKLMPRRVYAVASNASSLFIGDWNGSSWNWTERGLSNSGWTGIACSADGQTIALIGIQSNAHLAVSKDGGQTWFYSPDSIVYNAIAINDPGTILVAGFGSGINISFNGGHIMTAIPSLAGANCADVAISADGHVIFGAIEAGNAFRTAW